MYIVLYIINIIYADTMFYIFFSCTISSSPHLSPEITADIEGINHHLQNIEMLSNELHSAIEADDQSKITQLLDQLIQSNHELQQQRALLEEHLKKKRASPQ